MEPENVTPSFKQSMRDKIGKQIQNSNYQPDSTYEVIKYQSDPAVVGLGSASLLDKYYPIKGDHIYFDRYVGGTAPMYIKLGSRTSKWVRIYPGQTINRRFNQFWITSRFSGAQIVLNGQATESIFIISTGRMVLNPPAVTDAFGGATIAIYDFNTVVGAVNREKLSNKIYLGRDTLGIDNSQLNTMGKGGIAGEQGGVLKLRNNDGANSVYLTTQNTVYGGNWKIGPGLTEEIKFKSFGFLDALNIYSLVGVCNVSIMYDLSMDTIYAYASDPSGFNV